MNEFNEIVNWIEIPFSNFKINSSRFFPSTVTTKKLIKMKTVDSIIPLKDSFKRNLA